MSTPISIVVEQYCSGAVEDVDLSGLECPLIAAQPCARLLRRVLGRSRVVGEERNPVGNVCLGPFGPEIGDHRVCSNPFAGHLPCVRDIDAPEHWRRMLRHGYGNGAPTVFDLLLDAIRREAKRCLVENVARHRTIEGTD